MANQVETVLTEEILPLLQQERYVTLATVDHQTEGPNVNAISWVYAPDNGSIRFAVDNRSRIVENIRKQPKVTVTLVGNGSTYAIAGTAQIQVEKMAGIPLKLSLVEMKVEEVRDVMFYGSRMSQEPKYEKTYDKEAAEKLDRQVLDAIRTYE
ncbi:pyridoxamine 5'-phosphate oxidase family protein [Alteribacter aurantiacus]|uniref:pyridoxamine 5'-phosphate oxidase family protein n=1 Tax=Alteribacter aurantiacus TaxID=254410 RepID=UPI00040779DA|nr:pyridoxamine 5'-phosphate oxidase family protein [Alteribacter aurantiacus]